jgi:hypothetical protein
MHVDPIVNAVLAGLNAQAALAGDDPSVEAAAGQLAEALVPALRQAALALAEQAADEVRAQLPDRTVSVVIQDGDPGLRIAEAPLADVTSTDAEEFDARITLRLPPSLKRLVEDAATIEGESVNGWVVDALSRRANRSKGRGRRMTESFDL